jgi:hypothetical protein
VLKYRSQRNLSGFLSNHTPKRLNVFEGSERGERQWYGDAASGLQTKFLKGIAQLTPQMTLLTPISLPLIELRSIKKNVSCLSQSRILTI